MGKVLEKTLVVVVLVVGHVRTIHLALVPLVKVMLVVLVFQMAVCRLVEAVVVLVVLVLRRPLVPLVVRHQADTQVGQLQLALVWVVNMLVVVLVDTVAPQLAAVDVKEASLELLILVAVAVVRLILATVGLAVQEL
jgi:hypothetical protein